MSLFFNKFKRTIVPSNADIRLVAVGSGACDVSGGIQGYLARVI